MFILFGAYILLLLTQVDRLWKYHFILNWYMSKDTQQILRRMMASSLLHVNVSMLLLLRVLAPEVSSNIKYLDFVLI